MSIRQTVVGADVVCFVNSMPYGRVAEMDWDSETPRKAIRTIDVLTPAEQAPMTVAFAGNMQVYRLHQDGGIEATGMTATWPDLSREKYFSILVVDRVTDSVLFRADKCSVIRQRWTVRRGFVMGTISFTGLIWSNETAESGNA